MTVAGALSATVALAGLAALTNVTGVTSKGAS
jgi:hypothetical protein